MWKIGDENSRKDVKRRRKREKIFGKMLQILIFGLFFVTFAVGFWRFKIKSTQNALEKSKSKQFDDF